MISQRDINGTPNFALPRIENVWLEIPTFYKKLAVSVAAMFLGAVIGVITPRLTQILERLF